MNPETKEDKPAKSLGRRIALAIYLSFMVYIAVVGFSSVIPQVFWPEPVTDAMPPEGDCADGVRGLRTELREQASNAVGGADTTDLDEFLQRWDDQYLRLAPRCQNVRTYSRLGALRHRIEPSLRRFELVEGRLFAELEASDAHTEMQ